MKLDLKVSANKEMYIKAKRHYLAQHDALPMNWQLFVHEFEKENNVRVIVSGYNDGFPILETLDFKDVQAYTMFLLRWS